MSVYLAGPPGGWREEVEEETDSPTVNPFEEVGDGCVVEECLGLLKGADAVLLYVEMGFNQPGAMVEMRVAWEEDIPVVACVEEGGDASFIDYHVQEKHRTLEEALGESEVL